MFRPTQLLQIVGCASVLTQCTLPDVNLATPKPLEVNLNMRLDVYQYSGDKPEDKAQAKTLAEAVERMRDRQAEVQTMKDNRLVGEDHRALLQLRQVPAGKWGDRVKQAVEEENADRTTVMRNEALTKDQALHEVEKDQWQRRIDKAFKGEWIEVAGDKDGTYQWIAAAGPTAKKPSAPPSVKPEDPAKPVEPLAKP
jgi:Protein of unknown function (DUF1318)